MESSILYLHKDSTKIRSMMSWRQPLFRPRSPSMNPSEAGATAGGSKNQLRSTSLCCHNRSSCKAFGKSVTTKEHSGLSQALVSPASNSNEEVGTKIAMKEKGICLVCKLAKTLAVTHGWGVRKRRQTSCGGDDGDGDDDDNDEPPEAFDTNSLSVFIEAQVSGECALMSYLTAMQM